MAAFKYKDDVLVAFKNYNALCEKQSCCQLKILHTKGGKEYIENLVDYLKKKEIIYKVITAYSPEKNEKAQRFNHIMMSPVQAILI